ncbi:MAG: alpha/beta fold hydrolase [Bernardetiaceae bacterium]
MIDPLFKKYGGGASRFMIIRDAMFHYRDEGKGMPLVLIHGAFSSLHTFDRWAEVLKEHFRVIRYDFLGAGLTGAIPQNDYSIANQVKYLELFLNRLGIEQCCLVGNSMGGWISWEFTAIYPERVQRLVLIDAAGYLDYGSIPLPFKMARTPFLGNVVRYVIKRNVLEQFVREVYHDPYKVTQTLVDRYYELFSREGNPEAFMRFVNGDFRDNTARLRRIQIPTLILWGREDRWIPLEYGQRFHEAIPHNDFVIYDQVGHVPMEEIPHETVQDTLDFLQATGVEK